MEMGTLLGALQGFGLVALPYLIYKFYGESKGLLFERGGAEAAKFAHNTIHNHARTSGITESGKIASKKYSCGASAIVTQSLADAAKEEEYSLGDSAKKEPFSYTYVPQTRLHGGGWFAS